MAIATATYEEASVRRRRDELILANLSLVRHIVGRLVAHFPPGVDLENLEAAGTLGLIEAAGKFDPTRGVKFETFASWRIRGAAFDELRRNCPLPQHLLERVGQVRQAYESLPPPVTVEALADATNLTVDEITDCLSALRMSRMVSWENIGEPPVGLSRVPAVHEGAEWEEQKQELAMALEHLPERERLTVTLYYMEDLRLKEIGEVLHLSESRVSRILNAGLFHLGEFMRVPRTATDTTTL